MAAQAFYLKYRPQTFDQVVGQEPITRTLRNALRQGRIRQAYLFAGPRGTGKTTTARLLAKAVNCLAPKEERPCNECAICQAVNEGRLLDLIEIDAASNRGIDEIRDIREKVGFRPNEGRFKVYILDEAHMLTDAAFNALLKTLEEPPSHVIFTLVTTAPHKIPATIASRCQRFDFRRIPQQAIVDHLAFIAEQERVVVEPAALELIARQSTGALRDAISLLDQLTSYGDEITLGQVQMVLGTVASEAAGELVACLAAGDAGAGLDLINRTVGEGAEPRQFSRQVVEYLRRLLLVKEGAGTRLLNVTAEQEAEMEALAEQMTMDRLLRSLRLFNEAATSLKGGLQTIPQLPLELALVECTLEGEKAASPARQAITELVGAAPPPAPQPSAAKAEPAPQPQAEQSAPASEDAAPEPPAPAPATVGPAEEGPLDIGGVQRRWPDVLQAVRRRNPATYGALNTDCQPVELRGEEIVITFPHSFLRDKLNDPQRKREVEEALGEVLQIRCRASFVLAAEYAPQRVKADGSPAATESEQDNSAPALDDQALSEITRWAEERGGKTRIVP